MGNFDVEQILSGTIVEQKVKACREYAQNFYAAMCNMQWQRAEMWPILAGTEIWSVSWRGAGRIVANVRGEGSSYMDWYCSGMTDYDPENDAIVAGIVKEGTVTDEIREDMLSIGWFPVPHRDE